MEKKSKAVDINELGEFGLIERISKKIKTYNKTTILGPCHIPLGVWYKYNGNE